jgi:DNA primase
MSVWEEIKSKLSVEEVISDYVSVKSKGTNFTCVCPFHREKTPSLIISNEKQIWHCFGCGAGGDIFTFVQNIENLNQQEALQKLAKKAGVKLESQHSNNNLSPSEKVVIAAEKNQIEKGFAALQWTSDLYHQVLIKLIGGNDNPIKSYCLERGITVEIIKKFKLGYAPKGNFVNNLVSDPSQAKILVEVGILRE